MSSLYNIIAVLCAITLVALELKRTTFIRVLKKEEPNTWEKLGRPSGYFLSYLEEKGDRFIFTTIISATAHAKPLKANNSLNQS
ncbi:hypothetical protein, partial [Pseudomonas aeruginosa]